jgi:Protein of unknown function (DUF2934)
MSANPTRTETPDSRIEELIRTTAHGLWEDEGRPEGRAETHWMRASAIVAAVLASKPIARAMAHNPDWLKQGSEPEAAKAPPAPETPSTYEAIAKRVASRTAA